MFDRVLIRLRMLLNILSADFLQIYAVCKASFAFLLKWVNHYFLVTAVSYILTDTTLGETISVIY